MTHAGEILVGGRRNPIFEVCRTLTFEEDKLFTPLRSRARSVGVRAAQSTPIMNRRDAPLGAEREQLAWRTPRRNRPTRICALRHRKCRHRGSKCNSESRSHPGGGNGPSRADHKPRKARRFLQPRGSGVGPMAVGTGRMTDLVELSFASEGTRCRLEILGEWVSKDGRRAEEKRLLH